MKTQRQREAAMWLRIAKHIEQTGKVPGGCGICLAARRALEDNRDDWTGVSRSYAVVETCFGEGWPFGVYGSRKANEKRVIAATLLSLIVCTDQEPTDD